jgi:hypothetical protein
VLQVFAPYSALPVIIAYLRLCPHALCFNTHTGWEIQVFQHNLWWKMLFIFQNIFTILWVQSERFKRKLKRGEKDLKFSPLFSVKNVWKTNNIFTINCAEKLEESPNQCQFSFTENASSAIPPAIISVSLSFGIRTTKTKLRDISKHPRAPVCLWLNFCLFIESKWR